MTSRMRRIVPVALVTLALCPAVYSETGACCLPDLTCQEMTEDQCLEVGGFFGPGMTCAEVDCGEFLGACCLFDEFCFVTFSDMCELKGGVFSPGLPCDQIDCGEASVGACCLPDGSCVDGLLEFECINVDGVTHHPGQTCAQVECPGVVGGCCWGPFCLEATQADCESWVDSTWLGPGPTCQVDACSDQPGSCCVEGICLLTFEGDCLSMDGVYSGNGVSCEAIDCHPDYQTGACCTDDGICEQISADECDALAGVFVGTGLGCDQVECYSCPTDVDESGETNVDDLLILISHWNTSNQQSDINHDGTVNVDDLLQLMSGWGPCVSEQYTGGGSDLEGTFSMVDEPDLTVPLSLWIDWRIPIPQPSSDPIPIEVVELQLVGVSLTLGEVSIVCPSPGSGTVDLQGGVLQLDGIAEFSCELLDDLLPPERPFAGADYLEGVSQSYTFSIKAQVEPKGGELLQVVAGEIELTSVTPPDELPIQLAEIRIPIQNISMRRKVYSNTDCPRSRRCNKKVLCLQPVVIKYTKNDEEAETGLSLEAMATKADEIWGKICIEFEWRPKVTLELLTWNARLYVRAEGRLTAQATALLALQSDPDCIEIFFVDRFGPKVAWGLATNRGRSTGQVVINDSKCHEDQRDTVLAHEIGHILRLGHTRSGSGTLMEGPGRTNEEVLIRRWQVNRLRNPLLRDKTPKTECCVDHD